jgi:hypothetical protein
VKLRAENGGTSTPTPAFIDQITELVLKKHVVPEVRGDGPVLHVFQSFQDWKLVDGQPDSL